MRTLDIPWSAHVDISIDSHYNYETVLVENRTFYCMGPWQTAITLRWPDFESIAQCGAIFRNLCFKPGTHEWQNLITIVNGCHVVFDAINGYAGPTGNFHNGITLEGQCLNTMMSKLTFTHPITGVQILGQSEGPKITQSEIIGAYYGVVATTTQGEAGLWITDSHFAVARAGVVLVRRPQNFHSNLLIYRHPWRAEEAFDGILILEDSHYTNIHDVMVKTFGHRGMPVYEDPEVQNIVQHNVQSITGLA